MEYAKFSVTIPDEMYKDIKMISLNKKIKISHLVTEAIDDKLRKMKDEEFLKKINEVFRDPEIAKQQHPNHCGGVADFKFKTC
jgi:post-segregation antitoxin (ccd killing protein)